MAKSESDATHEELAYSILVLERQLEAYRRLHEEEMAAMYQVLNEIKAQILQAGRHHLSATLYSDDAD